MNIQFDKRGADNMAKRARVATVARVRAKLNAKPTLWARFVALFA